MAVVSEAEGGVGVVMVNCCEVRMLVWNWGRDWILIVV